MRRVCACGESRPSSRNAGRRILVPGLRPPVLGTDRRLVPREAGGLHPRSARYGFQRECPRRGRRTCAAGPDAIAGRHGRRGLWKSGSQHRADPAVARRPRMRARGWRPRAPSIRGSQLRRRAMLPDPAAPVQLEGVDRGALSGLDQDRRAGVPVQAQLERRLAASLWPQAADRVGYAGVQAFLEIRDPWTGGRLGLHDHGGVSAVLLSDGLAPVAWVTGLGAFSGVAIPGLRFDSSSRITGDRQGRATAGVTLAGTLLVASELRSEARLDRINPDLQARSI